MQEIQLKNYEITGILGTGADYEVRSAVALDTGETVVLKRPIPQVITRDMHAPIEARTESIIETYRDLFESTHTLCPLIGYTSKCNHNGLYNDGIMQDYTVLVFERAPGIPLVGDARSRILRIPIGIPQNLFALYPLFQLDDNSCWSVQAQLLETEQQFFKSGRILLDLGPQNVYYQPASGEITIIDLGDQVMVGDESVGNRGRKRDIYDFYVEMLKYYTISSDPPENIDRYKEPSGLRPIIGLDQELDEMLRNAGPADVSCSKIKIDMINKIKDFAYVEFSEFMVDLTEYLQEVRIRYRDHPELDSYKAIWFESLQLLKADHWRKYDFEAKTELSKFDS